jgi:hypothetical protein
MMRQMSPPSWSSSRFQWVPHQTQPPTLWSIKETLLIAHQASRTWRDKSLTSISSRDSKTMNVASIGINRKKPSQSLILKINSRGLKLLVYCPPGAASKYRNSKKINRWKTRVFVAWT